MFLTQSRSNRKRTRRTNRTELTMPPTAGRKIVTCKMKQEILDIATGRQALGDALKAVCRYHDVQPSQVRTQQLIEEVQSECCFGQQGACFLSRRGRSRPPSVDVRTLRTRDARVSENGFFEGQRISTFLLCRLYQASSD